LLIEQMVFWQKKATGSIAKSDYRSSRYTKHAARLARHVYVPIYGLPCGFGVGVGVGVGVAVAVGVGVGDELWLP